MRAKLKGSNNIDNVFLQIWKSAQVKPHDLMWLESLLIFIR